MVNLTGIKVKPYLGFIPFFRKQLWTISSILSESLSFSIGMNHSLIFCSCQATPPNHHGPSEGRFLSNFYKKLAYMVHMLRRGTFYSNLLELTKIVRFSCNQHFDKLGPMYISSYMFQHFKKTSPTMKICWNNSSLK